jgi:ParB family chromosome partitioning protein
MTKKTSQSNSKTSSQSSRRASEKGLGRGLKALLGDRPMLEAVTADQAASTKASTEVTQVQNDGMIAIEKISVNPWQPRQRFAEAELAELAESLKQHGIIQPLLVRPHPDEPDHYQLIAGERRWRAAQLAKLHQVPVVIRQTDEKQAAEMALIENIQRQDLNNIEEAEGYRKLMDEFSYTQEELAGVVGKSRSHLANTLRLLNLPPKVREMIANGTLSSGQARPLIGHDEAVSLAEMIVKQGLSSRQAEQLVAKPKSKTLKPEKTVDADLKAMEHRLAEVLGLNVKVDFNLQTEKGKVMISCASLDQFDALIDHLMQKP